MNKMFNHQNSSFNPLDHVKQLFRDDNPEYVPFERDGMPVLAEVGGTNRIVLVPRCYLPADAYRDWFYKTYPNGRVETIRHTKDPIWVNNQWIYPPEIFEVRLYENKADVNFISNGFANSTYKEGNEFNEVQSAISLAFKCAMRNIGFGVDLTQDDINEVVPKFYEAVFSGRRQIDVLPIKPATEEELPTIIPPTASMRAEEAAEDLRKTQILAEITSVSPAPSVEKPRKKAAKTKKQASTDTSPAEEVAATTLPADTAPGSEGNIPEFMEYLMAKEVEQAKKEAEDAMQFVEASTEKDIFEEAAEIFCPTPTEPDETSPEPAEPVPTEPVPIEPESEETMAEKPKKILENFTPEIAGTFEFHTVDGYTGPFKDLEGLYMGQIDVKTLRTLARPNFRWEDKVPALIREAAMVMVEAMN